MRGHSHGILVTSTRFGGGAAGFVVISKLVAARFRFIIDGFAARAICRMSPYSSPNPSACPHPCATTEARSGAEKFVPIAGITMSVPLPLAAAVASAVSEMPVLAVKYGMLAGPGGDQPPPR